MSEPPHGPATKAKLWHAMIPVLGLMLCIGVTLLKFGGEAHIPLLMGSVMAACVGWYLGHDWASMEAGILDGIAMGLKAILILCIIGIMISVWIAAGIVPNLILHGLELLSPGLFLAAACLICAIVSLATGSSWTTASTVGIALMGVAAGLNVPAPMAAGAIISGSYFGDKMSPLSDSTNLAPAVAGSELFEHIHHMLCTTLPALGLSLLAYLFLGLQGMRGQESMGQVEAITQTIEQQFTPSLWLWLPPALVLIMVLLRWPALPALVVAIVSGGILAMGVQGVTPGALLEIAHHGFVMQSGNAMVDELLSRGGLDSMMHTVALILCALAFGGLMERIGLLHVLAANALRLARSTGSLVTTTIATGLGVNLLAPDQYLSIILPGRMYREAYQQRGLHPKNLSRALEDGGTLSSPLIPWNSCGAFMATTLAVSPLAYLPWAMLNWLTPLISIALAYTGWTLVKAPLPQQASAPNTHQDASSPK
ncbi:MAG: Na+/H+ antiporter NhaC [Limisphaerales bacterium]